MLLVVVVGPIAIGLPGVSAKRRVVVISGVVGRLLRHSLWTQKFSAAGENIFRRF